MCSLIIIVNSVDKNYHFLTVLKYSRVRTDPSLSTAAYYTTHSTSAAPMSWPRQVKPVTVPDLAACLDSPLLILLHNRRLFQFGHAAVRTPVVHSTPPGPWREVFLPSDSWPPDRLMQDTRTTMMHVIAAQAEQLRSLPYLHRVSIITGIDALPYGVREGGGGRNSRHSKNHDWRTMHGC